MRRTVPQGAQPVPTGGVGALTEILTRFLSNKRIHAELAARTRPTIVSPPDHELEAIVALYGQGRLVQARDRAVTLLAGFANSEILHDITGAICAALGRFEEALGHYDHALALAPDYFEAWNNRGNMRNILLRGEEAIASFDSAIRLHPNYVEVHINRGIALSGLQRLDEALVSHERAAALAPASALANAELVNLRAHMCLWGMPNKITVRLRWWMTARLCRPSICSALPTIRCVSCGMQKLGQ